MLYRLDPAQVEEHLLDGEARGWVRRPAYVPGADWSMTDLGRRSTEELLAAQLDGSGRRAEVLDAHSGFVPLNHRLGPLMTRWQLRPTPEDPLAFNDHLDPRYDACVLQELVRLAQDLRPVTAALGSALPRFEVHEPRISSAVERALEGEHRWVDSPEVASMNIVWIQLHEDLLATLGMERGQEPAG